MWRIFSDLRNLYNKDSYEREKLCWLVFLTQQFHCILKMYFNMILIILKIFSPSFCEGKRIQCIFSLSFHKLTHLHHGIIFNNIKEWAIDPYSNLGGSHGHCAKQKSHSQKSHILCVIPFKQHSQNVRIMELEKLVFARGQGEVTLRGMDNEGAVTWGWRNNSVILAVVMVYVWCIKKPVHIHTNVCEN